jgi:hypothetical protein
MNLELLIILTALQSGVDPVTLLSIAQVESNMRTNIVGSLGEVGLFQLRPEYQPKINLFNPHINSALAAEHLKWSIKHCKVGHGLEKIICYNLGVTKAKNIKQPSKFKYYKKFMNARKKYTKEYFINKFESIPEEQWVAFYFEHEGKKSAMGHCGVVGRGPLNKSGVPTKEARALASLSKHDVEEINDGFNDSFKQCSPKQRVLAWLKTL